VAQVRVLLGENWAISLLTLTLKIQIKSQHTNSKPTSILHQDASSPRQQAKQCNTSAHVFILYDKPKKNKLKAIGQQR
jgi:hypothetical protein